MKKYDSVKEFINDLIDNEGCVFKDEYGRCWMYNDCNFWHKDLCDSEWVYGLFCLHLYGTGISKVA